MVIKSIGFWGQILALPPTSHVISHKLLNISVLVSHMQKVGRLRTICKVGRVKYLLKSLALRKGYIIGKLTIACI